MTEYMINGGYSLKETKLNPDDGFEARWKRREVEQEEARKASLDRLKALMPEGYHVVADYHGGHDEGCFEDMTLFDTEGNPVEWPKGQCAEVEETHEVYCKDADDNHVIEVWTKMVPKDLESLFADAAWGCLGEVYGSFAFEGNCHGQLIFRDGSMIMDGYTSYEQYEPENHEWE